MDANKLMGKYEKIWDGNTPNNVMLQKQSKSKVRWGGKAWKIVHIKCI